MRQNTSYLLVSIMACLVGGCSPQPSPSAPPPAPIVSNTQVPDMRHGMPPNAPPDKLVQVTKDKQAHIEALSRQARQQLPDVKRRFEAGLPKGQTLFVVTSVPDEQGGQENVFVSVLEWKGTRIHGAVATDMVRAAKVKFGNAIEVPEEAVADWMISRPDGSEEGNVVGKYMEANGAPAQ
jgi:uncharacterized protein YegJ (DUF2314 family)